MNADESEEAVAVGRRLRLLRARSGKTLDVVAGLAGITEGHLSNLENGRRALSRRSMIVALAEALEVSPQELFAIGADIRPDPATETAVNQVRDAMQAVDLGEPGGQVQSAEQLTARVHTALDAAQTLRLAEAGTILPGIYRDLYTSIGAGRDVGVLLRLAAVLSIKGLQAYLFSVSASHDLCWQAVRAGRDAAQRLDEPAPLGVVAFGAANGLVGRGAFDLAAQALDAAPEPGDLELDGMLTLSRCLLAAAQLRPADIEAPLAHAAELASRTGEGNAYWMSFGPSNVALWRVSVALESGDHERAAWLCEGVNMTVLPPGRQVTAHVARARVVSQLPQRRAEAVPALRAAERISPESVWRAPGTRRLLGELVMRSRDDALSAELRGMAYRARLV
ncbi:MAG: helix-turn-helix domain-containing protein [Pseudonocardiaceae bacterium]